MDDSSRLFLIVAVGERAGLLRDGLAREVLPGVLVAADEPVTEQVRALAVRHQLGQWETDSSRGRCLGYTTAAWIYTGVWPFEATGSTAGPGIANPGRSDSSWRLDLVIGRNRRSPRLPHVRVRQVDVPAEHLQPIAGLLVTRPLRTAADVARDLPQPAALALLWQLQELHDVHPPQVLDVLRAMPYARGAAVARTTVQAWADGVR